jgi:hypothetical protein
MIWTSTILTCEVINYFKQSMSDDDYGAEECEPQFDDKSNIFTHLNDSEENKDQVHAA